MLKYQRWEKKMKKFLIMGVVLLAISISISAVSADDGWSFDWSSSDSTNSDGGDMSFKNGELKLQDITFKIPDGYKENKSAQKLAADGDDVEGEKYSVCSFINGEKEIITKVFFSDEFDFNKLTPDDDGSSVEKTIAGIDGIYFEDKYGDGTPTFEFLKDGKIVEVNAPDDDTLEYVIK